jgi:hypothetical protein
VPSEADVAALGHRPLTDVVARSRAPRPASPRADPAITWIRPDGVIGGRVSRERGEELLRLLPSA